MNHLLVVAFAAVTLAAADATGTWTGTLTPEGGDGRTLPAHLVLKQDGDKLTGTAGPDVNEQHPIQNGRAENGSLIFELQTDGGLMKFRVTLAGDEITGDVTRERDGQTQQAKVAVKRAN
jgi:hypothetical protein